MNRKKIYENQFANAYVMLNEFKVANEVPTPNPITKKPIVKPREVKTAWYDNPNLQTTQDVADVASLGLGLAAAGTGLSVVASPASPFIEAGSTITDLANAGVYGARSVGALTSGEYSKAGEYALDAGLRGLAALPYVGSFGNAAATGKAATRLGPKVMDFVPTPTRTVPRPRPGVSPKPRTTPEVPGKVPTVKPNADVEVPKVPVGVSSKPGIGLSGILDKAGKGAALLWLADKLTGTDTESQGDESGKSIELSNQPQDVSVEKYKPGQFQVGDPSRAMGSAIDASQKAAIANDETMRRRRAIFSEQTVTDKLKEKLNPVRTMTNVVMRDLADKMPSNIVGGNVGTASVDLMKTGRFQDSDVSRPVGQSAFQRRLVKENKNTKIPYPLQAVQFSSEQKKDGKSSSPDVIKFKPGMFELGKLRDYISIFHRKSQERDEMTRTRGIADYFRKPGMQIATDYARSHWNLTDNYAPTGNLLEYTDSELYNKIKKSVHSYLKSKEGEELNKHLNSISKSIDNQ